MYMRHWLQSPSSLTHGNIIKREIFSKRTEDSTDEDGAILRNEIFLTNLPRLLGRLAISVDWEIY